MLVRDLITSLLDYNMDSEIVLCDNVEFEGAHGMVDGSVYYITSIESGSYVYLNFENRNHWKKVKE